MQKTLLTFGDSNTYGTAPMLAKDSAVRFPQGVRWPTVTHATLGPDWHLIEEGLPGRTATHLPHPTMGAHMDGQLGLRIALASHGPVDVLTILLGSNDAQMCYGLTPEGVTANLASLLMIARGADMQLRHPDMDILVVCPPPVVETGPFAAELTGAAAVSAALPAHFNDLAARWNIGFLDAGQHISSCAEDGIHFDAAAHKVLGQAVAKTITG